MSQCWWNALGGEFGQMGWLSEAVVMKGWRMDFAMVFVCVSGKLEVSEFSFFTQSFFTNPILRWRAMWCLRLRSRMAMVTMYSCVRNFRYNRVWNVGHLTSTVTCLPPFARVIQHFKDFSPLNFSIPKTGDGREEKKVSFINMFAKFNWRGKEWTSRAVSWEYFWTKGNKYETKYRFQK